MAELLLELLSEEIPASMQERAAADLKRLVTKGLDEAGLSFDNARAFATPRRLALVVDGLPEQQPKVHKERKGPRVDAPQKAIDGFMNSLDRAQDERVEERDTDRGKVLFAVVEKEGQPTQIGAGLAVAWAISSLHWPKSMRWGANRFLWVRPIHSLLAVFGGKSIPYSIELIDDEPVGRGLVATGKTRGHRFHAPEAFEVKNFADYEQGLRGAYVILDAEERKRIIRDSANELAAGEGLTRVEDEALVAENAGLVEWPVVLMGRFDEAFLELPPEALRASMRTHQKYFSLRNAAGDLAPRFIVVANIEAEDGGAAIIAGNERVLRARLADAKYFWDQDRKSTLESRVPALWGIVFFAGLGSLNQKADRMESLALDLIPFVPQTDRSHVRSAARLAKADLTTAMVAEFPELQGVAGRYYALADGESADVADAIRDHYSPLGPNDTCPSASISVAVALADKLDTLTGFFGRGEKPTGSRDPFALRRAALGVIRIILENDLRLPLRTILAGSWKAYSGQGAMLRYQTEQVADDVLGFIADRLKVHLRERGVRHDLIAAVFALTGEDDLVRLMARVEALQEFLDTDDGGNLLTAYKRAANIVRIEEKKDGRSYKGLSNNELADWMEYAQPEERALYSSLTASMTASKQALKSGDFTGAISELAPLRQPVDMFFDRITVNDVDRKLRERRLRFLSNIREPFDTVADFSQIEG